MDLQVYQQTQEKFAIACKDAESLSLVQNAGAAFQAVITVKTLRELLTDEIMKEVFMPLMNTKIGFLTDKTGKPNKDGRTFPLYSIEVVRDAIIDAASFGLLPTFNQFNIISEKMYPTKEGYTHLLKKLNVKYIITYGQDLSAENSKFADIPAKVSYEYAGEQKNFSFNATMPKNAYSSYDQLKGKAERRAKKMLYEYITGHDLGDGDDIQTGQVIETKQLNREVTTQQVVDQPEPTETDAPKEFKM